MYVQCICTQYAYMYVPCICTQYVYVQSIVAQHVDVQLKSITHTHRHTQKQRCPTCICKPKIALKLPKVITILEYHIFDWEITEHTVSPHTWEIKKVWKTYDSYPQIRHSTL